MLASPLPFSALMTAPDLSPRTPVPFQRTVPGGCQIAVLHRPNESRACLVVEVAAGSHDEPVAWPGLAHFLEHLLFLGGEDYPAEQRLLPFVQSRGGRVNASTGARLTEFHCEVAAELLEEAGLRMLDMLARPRLAAADQVSELRVLEAEYLARGADPLQQGLCALLDALASGHPCHAFVAGNGATLAPQRKDFRTALAQFHRRFYCAQNCRLMLVGPQSKDELLVLGERLATFLGRGAKAAPEADGSLLPLRARHWHLGQASADPRLWLGLVLQGRAQGCRWALCWLQEQLASDLPGSLQQQLRDAGLIDGWYVRPAYFHLGQAVLALDVELAQDDDQACARIRQALLDWLAKFGACAPWPEELAMQHLELPWRLNALAPLELARFWLERSAGGEAIPLPDDAAVRSLTVMLEQCGEDSLISVRASAELAPDISTVCGFPLALAAAELPAVERLPIHFAPLLNPLLDAGEFSPAASPQALAVHPLPGDRGALFLEWRWPTLLAPMLGLAYERRLKGVRAAAERLGVALQSSGGAGTWQLSCDGPVALLPAVVRAVRQELVQAGEGDLELGRRLWQQAVQREQAQMPIRRLLQMLPRALVGASEASSVSQTGMDWRESCWHGLLVGPEELAGKLAAELLLLPGIAQQPGLRHTTEWRAVDCVGAAGGDSALLLFCPQPEQTLEAEAAWRWLGQWLQAAFHRRMREELQLGYGLFSGFRQVLGHAGLLFAIQSPCANAHELQRHVDAFLDAQRAGLVECSPDKVSSGGDLLVARLRGQLREPQALGEWLWHGRLAGREYLPDHILDAIGALTPKALLQAFDALRDVRRERLVLTSRPARVS